MEILYTRISQKNLCSVLVRKLLNFNAESQRWGDAENRFASLRFCIGNQYFEMSLTNTKNLCSF